MTDNEVSRLAKKYIDDALKGQPAPSGDAYEAAINKVETETYKLLTALRHG
jgi:hypothetical protein